MTEPKPDTTNIEQHMWVTHGVGTSLTFPTATALLAEHQQIHSNLKEMLDHEHED